MFKNFSPIAKKVIFLFVTGVIIAAGVLVITASNNRGNEPYVYLKMNEGTASSTYDVMNNADATLQGGATWKNEEECVSGKCLYLDGSGDYVSIPDFALE